MKINIINSICCVILLLTVHSIALAYPKGCEVSGFGYVDSFVVLNEKGRQGFYLIGNSSNHTIELERHDTKDVFMSPSLTATLHSKKWAAFASDVADLHFQCFIRSKNDVTPVACQEVLDICEYPRVKFALSNMGNYWASVNKSQQQIIRDSIAKGILLRW